MSASIHFLIWIAVIGLLGFSVISFIAGAFDNDFAAIAANSDEYLKTPQEFKASAKANYRNAIIAFFVAISLLVISARDKRKQKSKPTSETFE